MDIRLIVFVLVAMVIHKGYSDDPDIPECSDKEFACADGKKCIYKSWLCDGEFDCDDSSDEKFCHPKSLSSSTTPVPTTIIDVHQNSSKEFANNTTPSTQEATSRPVTVPTLDPACEKLLLSGSCSKVGYRFTRLPNFFAHSNQNQVRRALRQWRPILQTGCSSLLEEFICRMYAPPCKASKIPCRSMCRRVKKDCQKIMKRRKLKWPSSLRCSNLPKKRCMNSFVRVSTTKKPTIKRFTTIRQVSQKTFHRGRCENLTMPFCHGLPYNTTSYPNFLYHNNQEEAGLEVHQFFPLIKVDCSPSLQLFLCTVYAPMCDADYGNIRPCRSLCETARSGCENLMKKFGFRWPDVLDCSWFPYDNQSVCIDGRKGNGMTTSKPSHTEDMRTTIKTPPMPPIVHSSTPTPQILPITTVQSESSSKCDGILTAVQGVVTSPNYPNAYPLQTQCKWTIKLPDFFNLVKITIDTMRLEEDRNCFYDYVMIVDKMLNQVGPRHCGTYRLPYIIPVRGNEVTIVFVSDDNTNKKGFSLSYKGLRT